MKTDSFKRWRKWGHVDSETLIMNVFNHLFGFTFLPRVANCKRTSFNTSCFRSFISYVRNNSLSVYLSFSLALYLSLSFYFNLCFLSLYLTYVFSMTFWMVFLWPFFISLSFFSILKFAFDEYHLIFLILDS
jgi:hypothetical protein